MSATDRTFPFIKLQNAVVHLQKRKKTETGQKRQSKTAKQKQKR
jgi:hypothetical protein